MSEPKPYRPVAGIVVYREPLVNNVAETETNIESLSRRPSERLYLIVKKPRDDHAWQFPQGGIKKKETVFEGALRELSEECGTDLQVKLTDTNVCCVYQYDYPPHFVQSNKKRGKKFSGPKVEFVRLEWVSGQCQPDGKEIIGFAWLTKDELLPYFSEDYREAVMPIFK
ncbi:unnamed protein product [Mucor hiemalis]